MEGEARSHAQEAALPIFVVMCSTPPVKKEVGRYTTEMILWSMFIVLLVL